MPKETHGITHLKSFVFVLSYIALGSFGGCTPDDVNKSRIATTLAPGNFESETQLRWSPKAEAVTVEMRDGGLQGSIVLGSSQSNVYNVRLEKSPDSRYFDILKIDTNQDAEYSTDEILTTTPNESRYKMWSSFDTKLDVNVSDSETNETVVNPYPISLWYVEEMREEQTEHALRFTRKGWMQGRVMIDGIEAHIRISEGRLDGEFTTDDDWTLALPDSVQNLFRYETDRPADRHAWLGEKAYQIVTVNRTGRSVELEAVDPGVTRAKEAEDDDQMAVDRRAPRSGRSVSFASDFEGAEATAKRQGKVLFIDFETVWCGPCKSMEEWVYTADAVVDAAADMISIKVDGDDFPKIVERFNVEGYPTMILVQPDGTVSDRLVGYQGVESMEAFLLREGTG